MSKIYLKFWKSKTNEQKVIMLTTILVSLSGLFILKSQLGIANSIFAYTGANIFLGGIQFLCLEFCFNKKSFKKNVMVSIPYIGFVSAIIIFLKRI